MITDRSEWNRLYRDLRRHLEKGVRTMAGTGIDFFTGYEYGTLYDWDQYFEGIAQLYAGWPTTYLVNAVKIFLGEQQEDGHIGRSVPDYWPMDMVKPFLAQLVVLCLQRDGNIDWLTDDHYSRFLRYIDHWLVDHDERGEGLTTWMSAGHTGMDNQHERAGRETDNFCEGIDLNSYLVRETRALALIAEYRGNNDDAETLRGRADERAARIRDLCWDESDGIFYDRDARTGNPIKVLHAGIFAALWAGIATAQQADRLVSDHLLNSHEFARPWPIPALAASEPGYVIGYIPETDCTECCSWRAHTWIPTNYYAFHGLLSYGYLDEARSLASRTYELFTRAPFAEYYVTEHGIGTGLKPFWGWSSLAMFMPLEASRGATTLPTDIHISGPAWWDVSDMVDDDPADTDKK